MLPKPDLWLPLLSPKLAIVSPPRLSLGRRMRLSSSFKMDGGGTAPGKITLMWPSMGGSVNAKQTASFGSIGFANVSVVREILLAVAGKGTILFSSKSYNSWLNGLRRSPKKQDNFETSMSPRQNFFLLYSSPDFKIKVVSALKGCSLW